MPHLKRPRVTQPEIATTSKRKKTSRPRPRGAKKLSLIARLRWAARRFQYSGVSTCSGYLARRQQPPTVTVQIEAVSRDDTDGLRHFPSAIQRFDRGVIDRWTGIAMTITYTIRSSPNPGKHITILSIPGELRNKSMNLTVNTNSILLIDNVNVYTTPSGTLYTDRIVLYSQRFNTVDFYLTQST
jgi:hypothetical protein